MQAHTAKPNPSVRDALEPWCAAGATGALRARGGPSGAVFLRNGRICGADCPLTSSAGQLLTAAGLITTEAWRSVMASSHGLGCADTELVRLGVTTGDLESAASSAFHSALCLLADVRTEIAFDVGATHPLGNLVDLDLPTALAEVDRRLVALHHAWPDPNVDWLPIRPVYKLNGRHVTLTTLQWEVVVNSGHGRTPLEVARYLGRDSYATALAARQLIRAGLLEAHVPETTFAQSRPSATSISTAATPSKPAVPRHGGALPHRPIATTDPGLALGGDVTDSALDRFAFDPRRSDSTLTRIRDALRALQ